MISYIIGCSLISFGLGWGLGANIMYRHLMGKFYWEAILTKHTNGERNAR